MSRHHDRRAVNAYLAEMARIRAEHKGAAQVDASGRVQCGECWDGCECCDYTGYIDDVGTVDAEDVRP